MERNEGTCIGCRNLVTQRLGNSGLFRCQVYDGPHGWRGLERSGHTINAPKPENETCWEPAKQQVPN